MVVTNEATVSRVDDDAARRRVMEGHGGRRPVDRWALGLVILTSALFLAQAWSTIGAPFGNSHDGRNAGVWAMGSQSLREDGVIASRLGSHSQLRGTYANHPPLIYVETAVAELLGGSSRAATRAPAWLGSLATVALLVVLLREAGLRWTSSAVAVATIAVTPMFLVYGTMLDTPVTSLPFGVALLVVWQRARRGRRVPPGLAAVLAALAPLAGWQALVVAAVVGTWALFELRRRSGARVVWAALAGGAVVGFVLLGVWLLWAFGGTFQVLVEQLRLRTGQSTLVLGWGTLFQSQWAAVGAMFGLMTVLLAAVGLAFALGKGHIRALALVSLAVTIPYPLVFRTGAAVHDYWNYWFLLPLAVGIGMGCDRLLSILSHRPLITRAVPLAVGTVAVLMTLGLSVRPPAARQVVVQGYGAALAENRTTLPPDQRFAWHAGVIGKPASWLTLATGRPAVAVADADLARVASEHPRDLILVARVGCHDRPFTIPDVTYDFETVAEAAARPPLGFAACSP
ncbi:MAG: hypothetical protein KY452_07305 [Actinobacteria bacterium]|nr:hypothetical protein [Actinomycetota bacterium]